MEILCMGFDCKKWQEVYRKRNCFNIFLREREYNLMNYSVA